MRRPLVPCLALLGLLGSSGCVVAASPTTGDLTLHYTFGKVACGAAGVSEIDVTVTGTDVSDGATLKVACATYAGGATIKALEVGHYTVDLSGLASDGSVRYLLQGKAVTVAGGANSYAFDLPAVTGKLTLEWTFAGSGACGQVANVRVTAVDPEGNPYDDHLYPCSDKGVVYDAAPAGSWTVSLRGLDGNGQVLYQAMNRPVQVVAGKDNTYSIDLQ